MNKSQIRIYFRHFGRLRYMPVSWSKKQLKDKYSLKMYNVEIIKL